MKKFLIFAAALFAGTTLLYGAPEHWTTDYDTAVKQAVKDKKSLLVLFTQLPR